MAEPTLSPDGRYLAALTWREDRYLVLVKDLNGRQDVSVNGIDPGEGRSFRWLHWASSTRLLAGTTMPVAVGGRFAAATRIIAMDPDGANAVQLFAPQGSSSILKLDQVTDLLPEDDTHILMSVGKKNASRPALYKVNIETGAATRIFDSKQGVSLWMTDQQNRIRLGVGVVNDVFIVSLRDKNGGPWQQLWQTPLASSDVFTPIGFSQDPDRLLVLSNHQGGPRGVYEYDLGAHVFTRRLFGHAQVDVDNVLLGPLGRDILGVTYILDGKETFLFDDTLRSDMETFKKAFPGKSITLQSTTSGKSRSVVFTDSPTDPGHYYLFDRNRGTFTEIGAVNPTLEGGALSSMFPVHYSARDGLAIQGYLTLPPGRSRDDFKAEHQAPLPMIVFPHGGPSSRDYLRYDYIVQFLANRGYGVFQMNFRGSSGYGAAFERAGYRAWGEAMQDDVTDGTLWLIDNGLADPSRICIFGGSYGGYSALMGAVKTPDLYTCAASLNGVFDLRGFIKYASRTVGQARVSHIGPYRQDRRRLDNYSPVKRVRDITIPIFLAHGDLDATVPAQQSRRMARALKRAGKPVQLLILEGSAHSLMTQTNRTLFLTQLEIFLGNSLR